MSLPVQPIILGDRTPPRYYTRQDPLGSWLIYERTPQGDNPLGGAYTETAARAIVTALNSQRARILNGAIYIIDQAIN